MAGEIRDAMAKLRAARQKMVNDLAAEIASVTADTHTVRDDGLKALELPKAELRAHRAEIQEIRDEFATLTNGGPDGPLPGAGEASEKPSPLSTAFTVPQGGRA